MPRFRCLRLVSLVLAFVAAVTALPAASFTLRTDAAAHTLTVFRDGDPTPILTQHARPESRPFLHPVVAPGSRRTLTAGSGDSPAPDSGIFWTPAEVNGRDYARHPGAGYWRRVSAEAIIARGIEVKWATTYELLAADGQPSLKVTQTWTLREQDGRYLLDFEGRSEALADLAFAKAPLGGLVVQPHRPAGTVTEVVNSNRQRQERADTQRAVWADVALRAGADEAHVAVFDHPKNAGYPLPWRVDATGSFGPSRALGGAWSLARGQAETVRHQILIYSGPLGDVALTEAWKTYTGETSDSVLWGLAKAEGKQATFLTGEQAAARMTVPPGFEAKLAAAEPLLTQPMAFCWDDRGRLWIAENRDYENRSKGFSAHGDSRIVILEDTDGDGRFDRRTVFLEGIPFPAAIAVGFDGLWLGAPPNLLFVPDRNHDDRADDQIEVRLTGWGIQDRHETLNSFTWGPDGWLYGCQGYATRSTVGKPLDGGKIFRRGDPFPESMPVKDGQYLDGGVWRYHPVKDRFEIVAHGFSNPWGLDFDDLGQMFITACVIPHLWHVIPGGIYHRQGGKHINPYVYDDIKTIADHRHRSAHGGARIYLADEFPAEYRGRIFMANIHEHAVLTDILEPRGSGFVGHHGDDTLLANDSAWVGFSMEIGPDGAVYVLDWHDGDICGNSLTEKETGRIYRLAPRGLPGRTGLDLAALSDRALVDLLTHRNDWYSRRARVLLQHRAATQRLDPAVPGLLWQRFAAATTPAHQLRALWTLHITQNLPAERLAPLLEHAEPAVRAWAVRLLHEDGAPAPAVLARLGALARTEPSPVVRLALASALSRLPLAERWRLAEGLVAHAEDREDHNLPKVIWYGVEPLVPTNPARALALAVRCELPMVTRFLVRRAVAEKQLAAVAAALAVPAPAAVVANVLEGLRAGLTSLGRREVGPPPEWERLAAQLAATADAPTREVLMEVNRLFGDAQASAAQLAQLQDPATPAARRREILAALARDGYAPALPVALALLDDDALRREALRALAAFDDPRIGPAVVSRYGQFNPADRAEAVLTLAARRPTAQALLAALRKGTIPRREVTAFAARQLQRVLGPAFVDFWGPVAQPADDKQADLAKFKRLLTDEFLSRADRSHGRALFERTCAACHTLYGTGGNVGPDLTGSNRANLDYILTEIINPSEVMAESYQLVTITTRDGRTLAGNVAAEDERQLTLRLVGQDTVLAKSEILNREKSPVSMMPEGLLRAFSTEEVRDLIAYLRTTAQVPLP